MIIDFRVRVPLRNSNGDPKVKIEDIYGNPETMARYVDIYDLDRMINTTLEDLLDDMDEAKVDKAILHAEYESGGYKAYHFLNERVAELVKKYPDKFIGFAGVDPRDGMVAVRELNRAVTELGLKGLNLQVPFQGLQSNDKRCYPLYAKCVELGIPVAVHVGIHFCSAYSFLHNNPVFLDEIACDFPELKIVGLHGGWPWVLELIGVAQRHPNVFIEYGAVAPKYLNMPRAGWEPIMQFGNSLLQNQILFGTDWPTLKMTRAVGEFSELPFKEDIKSNIFYRNTFQLLGLSTK